MCFWAVGRGRSARKVSAVREARSIGDADVRNE